MTERPRLVLARPADQSYEAFAAFINRFYEALTGRPADLDDAEIEASWRQFWAHDDKPDRVKKPRRSSPAAGTSQGRGKGNQRE
jgi:hypothetical protein